MKRRFFLNAIGALAGGTIMGKPSNIFSSPSLLKKQLESITDDETFWKIVREQFIFPKDYIYLNTGGIGALPDLVINKIESRTIELEKYPKPGHDHNNWIEVKRICSGLLGKDCTTDELALVSTATEGINIIINGLPLNKGDEIITSTHEHPALHIPLLNRMQRDGVIIRSFHPDLNNGTGNIDRIKSLINKKTKLIFLSHITCTTGQIFPIKEIADLAHNNNIWIAVDGAQAAGSTPIDIRKQNIDFYTFSGHKWTLGPKRTGVLYVKKELMNVLQPITVGAYSDNGYDILKKELKFQTTAQKFEFGTQNEAIFMGMGNGAEFIQTIGLKKIWEHNRGLAELFYNGLKEIHEVEILSPLEEKYRSSIISFKIKNRNYQELASYLIGKKRIRVRVVGEAGLDGVRVSFHIYNNSDEVIKILAEIRNYIKS